MIVLEAIDNLCKLYEQLYTSKSQNELVEMMIESGIAQKLESLQMHESEIVYKKIIDLIELYFEVND